MSYGNNLRKFLKQNNITVGDLSDKTGISRDTLKNILYDKTSKLNYIEKIAKCYNYPIDFFTGSTDIKLDCKTFIKASEMIFATIEEFQIKKCNDYFLFTMITQACCFIESGFDQIDCKIKLVEILSQGIKNGSVER